MDRSLETFPKSINYPVSRDTISPVDPKKPIYLDQVNTYIHIPRPPPPSLRKEEDQRTIITNDRSIHAQKRTYYQHLQNHAPLPPPPLPPPPLPPHHRPKTPPRLHLAQPHPNHPATLQIQLLHQPLPARKRKKPQHNAQSQPPGRHFLFVGHQNWRNHT